MQHTILITGANRGLGLEFVRQYSQDGYHVFACCREPKKAEALNNLDDQNVTVVELDVTNFTQLQEVSESLANQPIDIVLNNAGIYGNRNQVIGAIDPQDMEQVLKTNCVAPAMLAQAFLPHLQKGQEKVLANITSRMGSIADNTSGKSYAYRASKAALNALMHSMQYDVSEFGIKVLLLHPGWVKTDMGGESAAVHPKDSIQGMRELIAKAHELEGEFYHFEGYTLPW